MGVLSQKKSDVVLFYGHIGWSFGELDHTFEYEGKQMRARHADGKNGQLLKERF